MATSYDPPAWVKSDSDSYKRWLNRKANSLMKRDRKRGGTYMLIEATRANGARGPQVPRSEAEAKAVVTTKALDSPLAFNPSQSLPRLTALVLLLAVSSLAPYRKKSMHACVAKFLLSTTYL